MSPARMIRLEVRAGVTLRKAGGHRVPHGLESVAATVAAKNPDQVLVFLVARPEIPPPAPRDLGTLDRKDDRALAPFLQQNLVTPRGQHADDEPFLRGLADDPVDMREVLLV